MEHLHPLFIHFPIALLIVGVICDLVRGSASEKYEVCGTLGLWCTSLGLMTMIPAIGSGLLAQTFQEVSSPQVQDLINLHERLSYLELVLFAVLMAWRWESRGNSSSQMPIGYRAVAGVGILTLMFSSFIGGRLVYVHGMAVEKTITSPADPAVSP